MAGDREELEGWQGPPWGDGGMAGDHEEPEGWQGALSRGGGGGQEIEK